MIQEKIIDILSKITEEKVKKEEINKQTNIIDDIGLDSLQMINFILMLEDDFNIEIDFEEIDYDMLLSVQGIVDFITKKLES